MTRAADFNESVARSNQLSEPQSDTPVRISRAVIREYLGGAAVSFAVVALLWWTGQLATADVVPGTVLAMGISVLGRVCRLRWPLSFLGALLIVMHVPFPKAEMVAGTDFGLTLLIFWPWLVVAFTWLAPLSRLGLILGSLAIGVVFGYVLTVPWLAALIGVVTALLTPEATQRLGGMTKNSASLLRIFVPLICITIAAWGGAQVARSPSRDVEMQESPFTLIGAFGISIPKSSGNESSNPVLGTAYPSISVAMLACALVGLMSGRRSNNQDRHQIAITGGCFFLLVWALQSAGMHDQFRDIFNRVLIRDRVDTLDLNLIAIQLGAVAIAYLLGLIAIAKSVQLIRVSSHTAVAVASGIVALGWKYPASHIFGVALIPPAKVQISLLVANVCLVLAALLGMQRVIESESNLTKKVMIGSIFVGALVTNQLLLS